MSKLLSRFATAAAFVVAGATAANAGVISYSWSPFDAAIAPGYETIGAGRDVSDDLPSVHGLPLRFFALFGGFPGFAVDCFGSCPCFTR